MIHHTARLCWLVCCLILSCSLALAQNDDPFGEGPDDDPDPFGTAANDDPFGNNQGKPGRKPVPPKRKAAVKKNSGPSVKFEILPKPPIAEDEVRTNEAVFEALRQPVDIEMNGNSIEDLAGAICHRFEIPVQFDRTSIDSGTNTEERTLTFKTQQTPLFEVLSQVLRKEKLSFAVWNGALWICGPGSVKSHRRSFYVVTDLVEDSQIDRRLTSKHVRAKASSLKNWMMHSAMPDSWYQDKASISPVSFGADGVVLVIVQTVEGHLRVSKLLEDLRAERKKMSAQKAGTADIIRVQP